MSSAPSTAHQPGSRTADPNTGPASPRRVGLPEVLVGLLVLVVLTFGLTILVHRFAGATAFQIFLAALSFIAAGGGFLAAFALRLRRPAPFGVRRTTLRWLLIGLLGGLLAFVVKFPLIKAYVAASGRAGNAQADWSTAAATGTGALVSSLLFLGVVTPIGEELFFRGVLTSALLRLGPVVGVVGSALVFAVLHGAITTALAALPVGLVAAELRRRSDSIWPGAAAHVVFNVLSAVLAFVVAPALAS